MKKIYRFLCIFFLFCLPFSMQAQWIDNIWVTPANPSDSDTIRLYAVSSFPSGSCFQSTDTLFVTPPTITAYSIHCLGPLTYICQDTDIFVLSPMPAGSYTFIYHVDMGQGALPCTPGIVPGPVDSVVFHVSSGTGIPVKNDEKQSLQVVSLDGKGTIRIYVPSAWMKNNSTVLGVYHVSGQLVKKVSCYDEETDIDLSFLDAGVYFIRSEEKHQNHKAVKIILN